MLTNMSVITKIQSCTMSKAFSSIVLARRNMLNRTRLLACRHITTAPLLKAFSKPVATSRNAVTLNSTHAPLHRKHLTTTALGSTPQLKIPPNIIWTDITNARLDTVDIEAAKLAFQKSNPFNDPEAENFRIDFFMFLKPSDDGDGDSDEKRAAKWKSFYHEQALRVHGVLNKTISTSSASTVSPTDHVTARQWKNASATSSHPWRLQLTLVIAGLVACHHRAFHFRLVQLRLISGAGPEPSHHIQAAQQLGCVGGWGRT